MGHWLATAAAAAGPEGRPACLIGHCLLWAQPGSVLCRSHRRRWRELGNGLVLAAGNRLAAQERLTAARWQVLGAVALAGRPLTVPQIARRMGLTRQAVQASVNRLLAEALVEARDNLDHRRSPLIALTEHGRQKYAAVDRRQVRWINELSAGLKLTDLAAAAGVLRELGDRLETTNDPAKEEGTRNATT